MDIYEKITKGVYIIAEMSANHAGKLENALKIVEEAAKAGADCVKIQTYTADSLTIDCKRDAYKIKGGLWNDYYYYQLYEEAMTPWEWNEIIKNKCEEVGVDFLSTPFDEKAVDFLENLHVEFYKIASFEAIDIPLIKKVAKTGKPIIMSVGMASEEEIGEALQACYDCGNDKIVILKCCSQYPAKYEDMNIAVIPDMMEKFNIPVGLSDHSFGSLAPIVAVSLGAKVIEKHVCLNKDIDSADVGFSMTMEEFSQMVQDVRNAVKIKGKPTYELTDNEKSGLSSRRSLVAVDNIKKGEHFTVNNIRSIRPAIGIKPKYFETLMEKNAKKDYELGDPIDIIEIM